MKTTDSPNKSDLVSPPVHGAGTGFVIGVLGGMAAYYLTHSDSGQKLKQDLVNIWEHSRIESGRWLEDYLATPETPPNNLSEPTSLIGRLTGKLVKPQPMTKKEPKVASKHFFSKRHS
jgi:hypothetical protein